MRHAVATYEEKRRSERDDERRGRARRPDRGRHGDEQRAGRAVAVALAEGGADVALVARSEADLRDTQEEVSATGRRSLVLPTDLAGEAETRGAVERTVEAFGHVDVLVNAAGTDVPGPVADLGVEGWDRTLAVNLRAPFLLSKAAFLHMRRAGQGTIVNVSR